MALIFEDKVKTNQAAFIQKVNDIARSLGINPNWLMAVMYKESKLNPQAQNTKYPVGGGYATGLIQFVPDTARQLGTSVESLYQMDNIAQLDYVKSYFRPYAGKMKSYFDTYAAVFFPQAIGKPDDWVFKTSALKASTIARQNPAVDVDGNREITVAEFKKYLEGGIPAAFLNLLFMGVDTVKKNPIVTVLIGAFLFYMFTKER